MGMRLSGHQFPTDTIVSHPLLPLVLTTSHYEAQQATESPIRSSELILWRVSPVGPLNGDACLPLDGFPLDQQGGSDDITMSVGGGGGLIEVARVKLLQESTVGQSPSFGELAWIPCLLQNRFSPYPATLFVSNIHIGNERSAEAVGVFLAFSDSDDKCCSNVANDGAAAASSFPKRQQRLVSSHDCSTSGFVMQLNCLLPCSDHDCTEIALRDRVSFYERVISAVTFL